MKSTGKKRAVAHKSGQNATDVTSIVEDEFGNYRIKAGRLKGNFIARAFPKSGSNSQGLMAEASGASESDAIAALKVMLGDRTAQRTAARRWELRSDISVPSKEEFIEALRQTNLTDAQLAMLKAQAIAGEEGLTKTDLMNAAGYKSQDTAIKVLAKAGALVVDFLGVELTSEDAADQQDATRVLGFRQKTGQDERILWVMHEEMRHAVRATL